AQTGQQLGTRPWHRAALAADNEAVAIEPHLKAVAEAYKGVARQAFAAFHALQQETWGEGSELHERRYRRIEITRYVEWRFQRTLLKDRKTLQATKNPSRGLSG